MPEYEFRCGNCGEKVTIRATISEKEKGLKCPRCGSKDLHQMFTGITFISSSSGPGSDSSSFPPGCIPGGGCCPS